MKFIRVFLIATLIFIHGILSVGNTSEPNFIRFFLGEEKQVGDFLWSWSADELGRPRPPIFMLAPEAKHPKYTIAFKHHIGDESETRLRHLKKSQAEGWTELKELNLYADLLQDAERGPYFQLRVERLHARGTKGKAYARENLEYIRPGTT